MVLQNSAIFGVSSGEVPKTFPAEPSDMALAPRAGRPYYGRFCQKAARGCFYAGRRMLVDTGSFFYVRNIIEQFSSVRKFNFYLSNK